MVNLDDFDSYNSQTWMGLVHLLREFPRPKSPFGFNFVYPPEN